MVRILFLLCWLVSVHSSFVHRSGALNLPTHQMKYTRFHGCLGCPVQVFMFQLYLQCVSWLLENGWPPINAKLSRLDPMRGLHSLTPSVGSVSVTPNYNVTCIRVLTHVISSPGNFMIPLSALFLFLCRTRH